MRTLLATIMILMVSFLFVNPTLADICSDVEQKTGLDLNEAECYVLEQVEKGELADLQGRFPNETDRVVTADFLKGLMTGKSPDLKVTEKGVRIKNARVREPFYLRHRFSCV